MSPSWEPVATRRRTASRGVVIGVVISIVVVLVSVGVGLALVAARPDGLSGISSAFEGPPVPIAVTQQVPGTLTSAEPTRRYEFNITTPGTITIDVNGDFDSFLELFYEYETYPQWTDDDSGDNLNARILASVQPGRYTALVRPYSEGTTGSFTITVSAPWEQAGMPPPPPHPPDPSIPGVPRVERQTHAGVVASVSGSAPVTVGSQCVIEISPANTGNQLNCRVRVICNGGVIYGREEGGSRYGYNQCSSFDSGTGTPSIEAHDTGYSRIDGDPRIDLQTTMGHITVSEQGPRGNWSVGIRFTPPPSSQIPGTSI